MLEVGNNSNSSNNNKEKNVVIIQVGYLSSSTGKEGRCAGK